jgi:hypothetical protein
MKNVDVSSAECMKKLLGRCSLFESFLVILLVISVVIWAVILSTTERATREIRCDVHFLLGDKASLPMNVQEIVVVVDLVLEKTYFLATILGHLGIYLARELQELSP